MPTQLTNQEKVICANSRISESEYLAQKAKNVAGPMTVQINPGLRDATRAGHHATMSALPAPEREIAAAMNLDPRDYLARKVAGRAGTAVMRHSVLGVDGRAAINGARLEHRDLMEDESINVADLVAEARAMLDAFDESDEQNGWKTLAAAGAFVQAAIERCAPEARGTLRARGSEAAGKGATQDDVVRGPGEHGKSTCTNAPAVVPELHDRRRPGPK